MLGPQDIHVMIGFVGGTGHARAPKSIGEDLIRKGYEVTALTSEDFHPVMKNIGCHIAPLEGPGNVPTEYRLKPLRAERMAQEAGVPRTAWDMKHIFLVPTESYANGIEKTARQIFADGKVPVLIFDASWTGPLLMQLNKPGMTKIPHIGLGHYPIMFFSKDTAPPLSGFPPGPVEQNLEMYKGGAAAFTGPQADFEKLMTDLGVQDKPRPLFDFAGAGADRFLQLTVPGAELPRSDLNANIRFVGLLEGSNSGLPGQPATDAMPAWWDEFVLQEDPRPIVVASQGSLLNQDAHHLIMPAIEAAKDLPIRLIVPFVNAKLPEGFVLPDNVRTEEWIPFDKLFPHVDVLISNCGYNAYNQALATGVPIIAAGKSEDKAQTSMLVDYLGVGINLDTETPTSDEVKAAIMKITQDPKYKKNCLALKEEYTRYDARALIEEQIKEVVAEWKANQTDGNSVAKTDGQH